MPAQSTVTIVDETPGHGRQVAFRLELWSERVTARELIERRVRHEVRTIDAEEQVAIAWDAFDRGRILLLVDARQIESLDEPFTLKKDGEVCFYKLVPLVGG